MMDHTKRRMPLSLEHALLDVAECKADVRKTPKNAALVSASPAIAAMRARGAKDRLNEAREQLALELTVYNADLAGCGRC